MSNPKAFFTLDEIGLLVHTTLAKSQLNSSLANTYFHEIEGNFIDCALIWIFTVHSVRTDESYISFEPFIVNS